MPIYEYSCQKCGARLEVMQKITDKPLKRCKNCGGKLEKEWSTTSFQFKGTGWYVTDYAAKKAGAGEKETAKGGATETRTDGATDGATDAVKPAAVETKAEPAASTDSTDSRRKKTSRPAATSNRPKSD
ncbi:MAG TPA: zinc ribbon domain-containing protein [Pyrinomonadaceae bacterium]|nr:zinc ribbon domain-containing protein [Pyrinomonadaceae bacterium]